MNLLSIKIFLYNQLWPFIHLSDTRKTINKWLHNLPVRFRILIGQVVAVRAWNGVENDIRICPHNLGDDINLPLLETLLGCRVVCVDDSVSLSRPGIMAIGSMLPWHNTDNLYIWGSGVLEETVRPIKGHPLRVCAVRGPRTRDFILRNGLECPEIYGDPALLLPLLYNPEHHSKHKIGIIPHWRDIHLSHVQHFFAEHPDVFFIDFTNYDSWQSVIDKICSCEMIISSSLHGLIISDAYGVPNVFAQFSDQVEGGNFKYHDYMEGVGREWHEPLDFRSNIDLQMIEELGKAYVPIHFDPKPLLDAFPFPLFYGNLNYHSCL